MNNKYFIKTMLLIVGSAWIYGLIIAASITLSMFGVIAPSTVNSILPLVD
jgi:hypothetical protein